MNIRQGVDLKTKVTKWGNSHGLRLNQSILSHLNVHSGEELEIKMTDEGITILKKESELLDLQALKDLIEKKILSETNAVGIVDDPNENTDVWYQVFEIDPRKPIIREVPIGTEGAFANLSDAKEAARQIIQKTIATSKKALSDLRQLGIKPITYISL